MIISITRPPRQLRTWEYYRQNRTIKLHFMRHQRRVLEYFPKMRDFILPQTGLLRSMLGPSDLGPGGGSYNEPISCLQCLVCSQSWMHPDTRTMTSQSAKQVNSQPTGDPSH